MKKRLFYVLSLAIIVLNIVPVAKVYAAETKFEWVNQEGALEEDGDFWTWGYKENNERSKKGYWFRSIQYYRIEKKRGCFDMGKLEPMGSIRKWK